jgi:hypothetical protein
VESPEPEILHNATSNPSSEVPDINPIISLVFLPAIADSCVMLEFIKRFRKLIKGLVLTCYLSLKIESIGA